MSRRAAAASMGLCAALWIGCGASGGEPAGDPRRMSESEYDLARDAWLRQGNPRKALGHALAAVEHDDENAEAAHLVALIYLDFCRRDQADCRLEESERYARQALAVREDFREARNTLGVVLVHRRKYDDAIAVLTPLTQDILYETPENAWGNLGWAYLERGSLDRAVDALERSLALQPMFCVGAFRLGIAFERKRQLAKALEALDRALGTDDPGCRALQDGFAARGRVLVALGRPADARADLDRCVELSVSTPAGRECATLRRKLK